MLGQKCGSELFSLLFLFLSSFSSFFFLSFPAREVYAALAETGRFEMMTASQDENEHSMEMHMPYIAQVMKANESYTLVPILVGSSRFRGFPVLFWGCFVTAHCC